MPWTVDGLCRKSRRETINPRPSYQRSHEGVWSPAKKQLLIDSILRGYDLPKFYFRASPDSNFEYEIVDGQQRTRTIWEFVDGQFALGAESDDLPQGDLSNCYYDSLPAKVQDTFGGYPLTVVEIQDADEIEIRDLFSRLQEGTSLNPAERRNAMLGGMRDFIADIAGEHKAPNAVFPLTRIKHTRNGWDDLAALCVALEIAGGPTDIKAPDLRKMYTQNTNFKATGSVAKKVVRIFNYMANVLADSPPEMDIKWGFVDLYLVLSQMDELYSLKDREGDIAATYIGFELERRAAIAGDVADLIAAGHDEWDRDLYDYIQAFTTGGGKRENVRIRNQVYMRRFVRDVNPASKDPRRNFDTNERIVLWRWAGGRCQAEGCHKQMTLDEMHADHAESHSKGGATRLENGQALCIECNLKKGSKSSSPGIPRAKKASKAVIAKKTELKQAGAPKKSPTAKKAMPSKKTTSRSS